MEGGLPLDSKEMPGDKANWLFENGATLVVLDVPTGSEFGIDYNSWEVGDKFKGIKMIPPGFHYVYYSAVGMDRQVAPRTGFMYNFKPKDFVVKLWDKPTEDLIDPIDSELTERLKLNKMELDRNLGPYPYESLKKWISLTNFITPDAIERITPLNGKINSATPLESEPSTTQSRRKMKEDAMKKEAASKDSPVKTEPVLPDMKPIPGTELRFIQISERNFQTGLTPADITKHAMDHSQRLKDLMLSLDNSASCSDSILGELQLTFVCFLVGQVYEAFDQWKKIVSLMCSCVDAVTEFPDLYSKFIGVLHYHINEIPEDFFVDIVTKDNFLSASLADLFENINVSDCPESLKKRGKSFRNNLEKKFSWSFEYESGEYAPLIVEEAI